MKKLTLLHFFLLFSFAISAVGQSNTVPIEQSRVNNMNELMKQNTSSLALYYKGSEVDVDGSKYVHDAYAEGELWLLNGDYLSKGYLFKFDEAAQSVQIKDKDGKELLLDAANINGCRLSVEGKSILYFRSKLPGENNIYGLFQLLYQSDNYSLVKLPKKTLVTKQKMFHDDELKYQFISQHRYFIKKDKEKYQEIDLKKRDLLAFFAHKKNKIEQLFDTPPYRGRLKELSVVQLLTELEKTN